MTLPLPGPRVAGLDLSWSATGLALAADGEVSLSTLKTAPRQFRSQHARLDYIARRLIERLAGHAPVLVCVEGPAFAAAGQQHSMGGLWWHVTMEIFYEQLPMAVISPSTLKLFATGKGKGDKTPMAVAAAMRLGRQGMDDNQIDALWLAAAGLDHLGFPLCPLPRPQRDCLHATAKTRAGTHPVVRWPDVETERRG